LKDEDGADRPEEACGVFAVYAPGRLAANLTFDGLYALQHRGQESAGMAVSDRQSITVFKNMGLVSHVFDDRTLASLPGDVAIGHTRYSTTGASNWRNAQPSYRSIGEYGFALGHNGNLTNTSALAQELGMLPGFQSSDTDIMAELISQHFPKVKPEDQPSDETLRHPVPLVHSLLEVLPKLGGAFSLVLMDVSRVIGVRDPNGFRPLCLGRIGDGYVLASESPALDVIGAEFIREIAPGEMVVLSADGVESLAPFPAEMIDPKLCIFEFVYFARPDTKLLGREVHGARRTMGELLAKAQPVGADLVMGVPDSGVPAAEGYAKASGIPYGQGLVKNRYIGRTFIAPDPSSRVSAVRRKLNPLAENIAGKRLVVVDDSIVRGTTTRSMVRMLKDAGATEVHLRISSPPYRWPCFYGIDTPSRPDLLAAHRTVDEMRDFLGADSLAFLSLESLRVAVGEESGFCDACLTGTYPTRLEVTP
jgi:amidophosphoribosyltransferase